MISGKINEEFFESATSADYRKALSGHGLDMVALDALADKDDLIVCKKNKLLEGIGRISYLDWDSRFFGLKAAQIDGLYFISQNPGSYDTRLKLIEKILRKADSKGFKFLTCRVSGDDTFLAHALEEKGFRLCDVLNIYLAELDMSEEPYPDQREEALEILDRCLEGMIWGRMYQDPNIDSEMAMKFYRDTSAWILSQECHVSISRENNRGVGLAIGVIDGKMSENIGCHYGFLWLIAVDPEFQGKGVGKKLFYKFQEEFSTHANILEIGTQVSNLAANQLYLRAGCRPLTQALTFHRWGAGSASE